MKFITPLALIAAACGLLYLFVKPHYENVRQFRNQVTQYNEAIVRAEEVGTKRNDLLNRSNSFSPEDVQKIKKLLPDTIDNIRLIIDINNLTARYGSVLKGIGVAAQAGQKQDTIGPDNRQYGTVSITYTVSMTYDQFKKYLGDLEKSLRILDVSALAFKPDDKSSTYDFAVTLTTYWLK